MLLTLAACTPAAGQEPAPATPAASVDTPAANPASEFPRQAPPQTSSPTTTRGETVAVWTAPGRIDSGAGPEQARFTADGTFSLGSLTIPANVEGWAQEAFRNQVSLKMVALDASTRAFVLALPGIETEDPPTVYQVFVVKDGALKRILHQSFGVYGHHPLTFQGEGKASYLEDGWTACDRAKLPNGNHPSSANRQRVTLGLNKAGMLVEVARIDSEQTMICDHLAG